MSAVDWSEFEAHELVAELRHRVGGAEGEKMIWAFEQAIRVARIDEGLLDYLLAATVCLVARVHHSSPRAILEQFFRRSISDDEWRQRYLPLFE
jgi:hypothetical protein